jgi:hypothetical protein
LGPRRIIWKAVHLAISVRHGADRRRYSSGCQARPRAKPVQRLGTPR